MIMGTRKSKTLTEQVPQLFKQFEGYGRSKAQDKIDGISDYYIYSYSTMHAYQKQARWFAEWMESVHPEVKKLKKASIYLEDYMNYMDGLNKYSAWTLSQMKAALCKMYQLEHDEIEYTPPQRKRKDIKRSRCKTVRAAHFSETNNKDLIDFCRGTGLRRDCVARCKKEDLRTKKDLDDFIKDLEARKDTLSNPEKALLSMARRTKAYFYKDFDYFIYVKGKGGRVRFVPILKKYEKEILDRFDTTLEDQRLFKNVHSGANIHGYRADYARMLYNQFARPIEDIPYDKVDAMGRKWQSDVYVCRKDEAGKAFDRAAVGLVSTALGHNRVDTAITNYLYSV